MSKEKICPKRKGNPCVEDECAWFYSGECAVFNLAEDLYALGDSIRYLVEILKMGNIPSNKIDDDVPF